MPRRLTIFQQLAKSERANGRGPQSASFQLIDLEENMTRERIKDFAFGLGSFCSMVLIVGAVLVGAYLTTLTFVTQYSVLAERYVHFYIPGR